MKTNSFSGIEPRWESKAAELLQRMRSRKGRRTFYVWHSSTKQGHFVLGTSGDSVNNRYERMLDYKDRLIGVYSLRSESVNGRKIPAINEIDLALDLQIWAREQQI